MKRQVVLVVCFVLIIIGCGDSTGGYGIYRSSDMVTVFVPLPDTSEIAEAKVDNNALHVDIDTGEKIVSREIKLQSRLVQAVEPGETVVCDDPPKFVNVSNRSNNT